MLQGYEQARLTFAPSIGRLNAINAILSWRGTVERNRSQARQDRVLATSTTPVKLLAAHGGVVDMCRNFNIIILALTGLVRRTETP